MNLYEPMKKMVIFWIMVFILLFFGLLYYFLYGCHVVKEKVRGWFGYGD